jgi:anthranilate phosphoribosyltransferase
VLDGGLTDLEIGAFCIAMRVKGETALEMAGFLDATHVRLNRVPTPVGGKPLIVIPSYNGARKLPVLTPLLGLLLAREGLPVLIHGMASESSRVYTSKVLIALGIAQLFAIDNVAPGILAFAPTGVLCPGLQRLLDVRRVVGLRNSAHSVVKLMNPCDGPSLLVTSYTHPEYALSMSATLQLMQSNALLLRGTEGEAVADARRSPQMDGFVAGQPLRLQEAQGGALNTLPDLPKTFDADTTAHYIRQVMAGTSPVPAPIAQQVEHILRLVESI